MKKAVTWIGILVTAAVLGKMGLAKLFKSGEEDGGKERVRLAFEGLKPGGNLQMSICMWDHGGRNWPGDQEAFNKASDGFDAWVRQKGIAKVTSLEITEAKLAEGGEQLGTGVVLVTALIDGTEHTIRATPDVPLEWVR